MVRSKYIHKSHNVSVLLPYSPTKITQTVKSITAREAFHLAPKARKKLWGGEFWGKGYFVHTVGRHADVKTIANYVKDQVSKDYTPIHRQYQLRLFRNASELAQRISFTIITY